ncbi:MAG: alpha-glucan family phosphorylase [Pyrinomonadaceae bacterium]
MVEAVEAMNHEVAAKERVLPSTLGDLERLSKNYWWSWAADGAAVFRDLDPYVWKHCENNPRRLLSETSEVRLTQMATDPAYIHRVRQLAAGFDRYMNEDRAAAQSSDAGKITSAHPIAYFCAEYGVHNSLPLYSGGLGMLAGDHLKSASDLNLPLVAVGMLYRFGYFRQKLSADGWQQEHYGEVEPSELAIREARDATGAPIVVEMLMRERPVRARVWRVDVGRVPLYLLDTNIVENSEVDRLITGHLYGGDRETRVVQEMLLGIGGVRLLRRLGIEPSVYHLNEGHSAFLTLELAREIMEEQGVDFTEAAKLARQRSVFTTHTPIAAGNDEFAPEIIEECFGASYEQSLGLTHEQFLNLGKVNQADELEWFGMTPLAIRMCRSTNGVSRKHGEVSRALWQAIWPEMMNAFEVPITSVTNGVHAPTWIAPLIGAIYEKHIGAEWTTLARNLGQWSDAVKNIGGEELWKVHCLLKERLVAFIRHRTHHSRLSRSDTPERIEAARTMFDPAALTIGFARRVAAYKRWGLLVTDPERLMRLMNDENRPVQFVFAGKAHPQDEGAKQVLQQLAQWKFDPLIVQRAVFIQDYDQEIARQLVQSVDVWLNVPRKPLEASGTSGQKVAMNGGLNLSVLDGWWIEGYDGTNGWAIGDESAEADEANMAAMDARDADLLYRVLEEKIVPLYYERDSGNLPQRWIAMMLRSIETLTPAFNSDRMVEEYVREIYTK